MDNWIRLVSIDPYDPKVRYKRDQIAKMVSLTDNQKTICDLYILEENTGKRHWELDPEDKNIYMEWMVGTNLLRNKINVFKSMSRQQQMAQQQKATYNNNGIGQQQLVNNSIGNISQPQSQQPERIIRTSSGKEIKASERPDLAKLANKPKRYPRRNR